MTSALSDHHPPPPPPHQLPTLSLLNEKKKEKGRTNPRSPNICVQYGYSIINLIAPHPQARKQEGGRKLTPARTLVKSNTLNPLKGNFNSGESGTPGELVEYPRKRRCKLRDPGKRLRRWRCMISLVEFAGK